MFEGFDTVHVFAYDGPLSISLNHCTGSWATNGTCRASYRLHAGTMCFSALRVQLRSLCSCSFAVRQHGKLFLHTDAQDTNTYIPRAQDPGAFETVTR